VLALRKSWFCFCINCPCQEAMVLTPLLCCERSTSLHLCLDQNILHFQPKHWNGSAVPFSVWMCDPIYLWKYFHNVWDRCDTMGPTRASTSFMFSNLFHLNILQTQQRSVKASMTRSPCSGTLCGWQQNSSRVLFSSSSTNPTRFAAQNIPMV